VVTEQATDKVYEFLFDIEDLLIECLETLDNYSDVIDGGEAGPLPNQAMSSYGHVSDMLDRLRGEIL
jgi:hypothetical protein